MKAGEKRITVVQLDEIKANISISISFLDTTDLCLVMFQARLSRRPDLSIKNHGFGKNQTKITQIRLKRHRKQ